MRRVLFPVCLLLLGTAVWGAPVVKSVLRASGAVPPFQVVEGRQADALAWGSFDDETIKTEGWGRLYINTEHGTAEGWYAAGFLEGTLTALRTYQHYRSWYDYTFKNGTKPPNEAIWNFLEEQYRWASARARGEGAAKCRYRTQLGRILSYFDGLAAGQASGAPDGMALTWREMLLLQAAGDVYDLINAFIPSTRVDWASLSESELFWAWHERVSCSALWKINDALSEVLVSHATWSSYQVMLRTLVHYDLAGHTDPRTGEENVGRYKVSFSGKPGVMYSKDDFYTLPLPHQRLVVLETTNGVLNYSVYSALTSRSLLTWQNVPLCNALARSAAEWTKLFAKNFSGTYTNQWMVGDMKLFAPGEGVKPGFLHIIEVMPGVYRSGDVTDVMTAQGNYWPSYNLPYFPDIYELSGVKAAYEKYGDYYSYTNTPRAKIFQRDHSKVQNITGMERMIRYNDWKNDPLSLNSPAYAIASRADLLPDASKQKAFGALDAKVSSYTMVTQEEGALVAQSGPTADQQPPFSWAQFPGTQHPGQPEVFNFPFVRFDSSTPDFESVVE